MSSPTSTPLVFKPLPPWKGLAAAGAAVGFVVIVVMLTSRPGEGYLAWIMAGVGLLALLVAYLLSMTSRLVVSEAGIAYLTPVLNVTSTWDNIAGYGTRIMGIQSVEVLLLRQPVPTPALLEFSRKASPYVAVLALLSGRAIGMRRAPQYEGMIPVSLFDPEWRYGPIGEMLKRCAPEAYNHELKREEFLAT